LRAGLFLGAGGHADVPGNARDKPVCGKDTRCEFNVLNAKDDGLLRATGQNTGPLP